MPICDVCNAEVMSRQGFLMTTQQVISTSRYWEHAFKNQWSYYGAIDPEGKSLALTVRQQVGQNSPWLICDGCIGLFGVDQSQARSWCEKWWSANQRWSPPGCGPGSMGDAVNAASEGWEKAFGKRPNALSESVPLAASLHTFDRMGLEPHVVPPSFSPKVTQKR